MRLLILGAAGFIGSHLVRYAVARGHTAIALCRSGKVDGFLGPTFKWELGQLVPEPAYERVDCALHLAHDFDGEDGADLTRDATLACVDQLRAVGVDRQLFFSSYSAGTHAVSTYGRTKFVIEQAIKGYSDVVVVRPGLVLGDGGLYGRIQKWAQRLPLIPLPDGGDGLVPIISIDRLCRETLVLASQTAPPFEANLFEPRYWRLRQVVLTAAAEVGRRPWVLPVPSALILGGLQLADLLHLHLPVTADNLKGFLANHQSQHSSTLTEDSI
jgi:uncharacterized protein YbjT (DUF2867 family)